VSGVNTSKEIKNTIDPGEKHKQWWGSIEIVKINEIETCFYKINRATEQKLKLCFHFAVQSFVLAFRNIYLSTHSEIETRNTQ